MSKIQKKIFFYEYKKFILELLYFYWNLSEGNPIVKKIEKHFNASLAELSAKINRSEMTDDVIAKMGEGIRESTGLIIIATVFKKEDGSDGVRFELFSDYVPTKTV